MIDSPPLKYSSAIEVLKIGMLSREEKLKHSTHELFTFPPEQLFMEIGRAPIYLSEDNRRIIVRGERTYAVRFAPHLGRTIWLHLFNEFGIRNIAPFGSLSKK